MVFSGGGSLFFHTTLSKNLLDYPCLLVVTAYLAGGSLFFRPGRCFLLLEQSKLLDYPTVLSQGALCRGVVHFLDCQYQSILYRSILLIVQFLDYPIGQVVITWVSQCRKLIFCFFTAYYTSFLTVTKLFLSFFLLQERGNLPATGIEPLRGAGGRGGVGPCLRASLSLEKPLAATFHGGRLHADGVIFPSFAAVLAKPDHHRPRPSTATHLPTTMIQDIERCPNVNSGRRGVPSGLFGR